MRKTEFMRMREIEKEKDMDDIPVGGIFMYGQRMIGQKQNKTVGQSISYFQILNKTERGVEYIPIFEYMEEDKGE